ncbi:MAG: tetratricopeptide repeat protein [Saprospiraceae bacterium]
MKYLHTLTTCLGLAICLGLTNPIFAQAPPAALYQKATDLFKAKEFAAASVFYELVLHSDPKHDQALRYLGISHYELDKFNAAITVFEQLLQLKTNDLEAREYRANAYVALGAYAKAILDYDHIIAVAPGSIPYVNRARANFAVENFELAQADFNQALQFDEKDSEALAGKADIYYEKGQYEKALDFYSQSIAAYQLDPSVYNNRANTYSMLQLTTEALQDYNQALRLEESSTGLTNRGKYYLQIKNYDEAALDCIEASLLDFNNPDAYHCAGVARQAQGQLEDALENFEKAVALAPDWATAISDLGLVKFELGDYLGAYQAQQRALSLTPNDTRFATRWQDCQKMIEQHGLDGKATMELEEDEAIETEIISAEVPAVKAKDELTPRSFNRKDLRIATILTPQFAKRPAKMATRDVLTARGIPASYTAPMPSVQKSRAVRFEAAVKYNKVKNYTLAIEEFDAILSENPSDHEAYNGRGIALYGNGEAAAAIDDFNHAIAVYPDFVEAYYNRGRTQYMQGKVAAAIDDFSWVVQHRPDFANAYRWRGKCYEQMNYVNPSVMDFQRYRQFSQKK